MQKTYKEEMATESAEVFEKTENSHIRFNASVFSSCSDCSKNLIICTTLRMHLVKDHSVKELEVDELVLRRWIEIKLLKYKSKALKLICPWCQEVYIAFQEYYDHLHKMHLCTSYNKYCELVDSHVNGGLICYICEDVFKSVLSLDDHFERLHSDVSSRVCLVCQEDCLGKSALLRHINHHILGVQKCPVCPCRYSTQRQFSTHLEFFHKNKYSVKCTQCTSIFNCYSSYETHKNVEHSSVDEINSRPSIQITVDDDNCCDDEGDDLSCNIKIGSKSNFSVCDLCNINFANKAQYDRHLYSTHPSVFKYRCEECECLFKVYGDLISHQMSHFVGFHHCPHCNVKFSKVDQIKKHLKFSHPFVKSLECKLCIKNFKSYDTYLNHLKLKHPEVSGKALLNVECEVCHKQFVNGYQLQLHSRSHQKELCVCTVCDKKVKNLSLHMNSHTKLLTYQCIDCNANFNSKSGLIVHRKRVHLGDSVKKHQCKECNKKFMGRTDLETHVSRVHRSLRNFRCNFCEKMYKNKVSLIYHERKHTEYKPNECTVCQKSFTIPTFLKHHMEKDHKAIYKGIYYKNRNLQLGKKGSDESQSANIVHISVSTDMKKEVISSWDQEQPYIEKVVIIDD